MGKLTIRGDTLRSAKVSMAAVTSRLDEGARDLSSAIRHSRVIIPEASSNVVLLRDKAQLELERDCGDITYRDNLFTRTNHSPSNGSDSSLTWWGLEDSTSKPAAFNTSGFAPSVTSVDTNAERGSG